MAAGLIGAGILVLFTNLDLVPYAAWHRYWPALLIVAGLADVIYSGRRSRRSL